jgi:ribonuclease HI
MKTSQLKDLYAVVDGGCLGNNQKDLSKRKAYGSFKVFANGKLVRHQQFDLPGCKTSSEAELGAAIIFLRYVTEDPCRKGLKWLVKMDSQFAPMAISGGKLSKKYPRLIELREQAVELMVSSRCKFEYLNEKEVKAILGH